MSLSKLPTLKSLASSLWNVLVPDVDALEERRDARLRASSNLVIPIEPGLYDALELTGSQIRLVILKPLLRGPPWVTCDLIKTYDGFGQLSCPEYYALSYTWRYIGHDIETKSILINGREVVIGTNLWYALYQLSPKTGSLKIWIDALCINQKNVEERNSQVMQMGRIYSEAKRVIVWLGQEDAQTRQAIKCIEYLANPQPCRTSEDPSSHVAIIAATLTHFFDRQYWRRVWIVQEVILAKSITIYSGACMLEWDTFVEACHHPGDYGISEEMADICLGLIQQSTPAHFERLRADPDKGRTLMGLLHASQENNATDTRDMVYGLLGIANDSGFLEVDYDKSPVQLWHDLL
ncbi:heterokaryon incompatibility protein-domain-containing protein, partial [Amylocarpus encephaloides]